MDSPVGGAIGNIAGRAVGLLGALTSIKGGGLGNFMLARQRALADPGFRATLAGSPFTAGFYQVGGGIGPVAQPGAGMPAPGGAAAPEELQPGFVGPAQPSQYVAAPGLNQFNVPGYEPGTARQWQPNLPPYAPKEAIEEAARASIIQGVSSQDTAQRAANKTAAGIIPTPGETDELIKRAVQIRNSGGLGTVVQVDIPGMRTNVGSPYSVAPVSQKEYPTPGEAAANRLPNEQTITTNRGTFMNVPIEPPATPPTPAAVAPSGAPATPAPAPAPGATGAPGAKGGGVVAPRAVPQTTQVPPPPPNRPAATTPPPTPARPSVRTGTPGLGAGYVTLPPPPTPPPAYGGGPYDPNAIATEPAYPSAAPPPEEDLSATAGPGFLSRAVGLLAPAAAEAAEAPGWTPPTPAPAAAPPARPVPGWGPPPETAVPTYAPPQREVQIIAPALPATGTPRGTAGRAVAPEMPGGTAAPPLTRRTYTSASGQQDVYEFGPLSELQADAAAAGIDDFRTATPEQRARFDQLRLERQQREQVSTADITRTMRPLTESEQHAADYLMDKRLKLDKFYRDFPDPEERVKYVGWVKRWALEHAMILRDDPRFKLFQDDLSAFDSMVAKDRPKYLEDSGIHIEPGGIPTGREDYASQFEQRLDDFNFDLNAQIYRQIALRQIPSGEMTQRWVNLVDSYFDQMYADRLADKEAARKAAQGTPTTEGPPATIRVLPPMTTTTTQPPQAGGFNVLEDRPQ